MVLLCFSSYSSNAQVSTGPASGQSGDILILGNGWTGTVSQCTHNVNCWAGNTDSGDINYNGSNFLFLNDKANIFSDLTILNNLKCILRLYNQDFSVENYEKYLVLLELKEFENLPLKYLSKGNLQRNKLLIALNLSWKYLLIDEPFTNLDDSAQNIFRDLFLNLKSKNKTIIFSTHNFKHISDICDESIKLENGKIAL